VQDVICVLSDTSQSRQRTQVLYLALHSLWYESSRCQRSLTVVKSKRSYNLHSQLSRLDSEFDIYL
jgi:hypothetical protein